MSSTTSQLFVPFSGQTFRSFSPTDSTSLFSGRLMEGNDWEADDGGWLCLHVTMSFQWQGLQWPVSARGAGGMSRAQTPALGVNVRWPLHWLTGHWGLLGRFVPAADLLSAWLWHLCQFATNARSQPGWQVSCNTASCPPNCTPQSCLCVGAERMAEAWAC